MPKPPAKTTIRKPSAQAAKAAPAAIRPPAPAGADGSVEERIRQRAYELYEQEGCQEGRDQEYWLRAEAEIRGRKSA